MRTSQTLLSAATVAALALLAATSARATDTVPPPPPPIQCTTNLGGVTFKVSNGPSFVSCLGVQGGQCTEIEYELSSPRTVVYTLQGWGVKAVDAVDATGESITIADPCVGIYSLGRGSCHEQAIKIYKATPGFSKFKITLAGLRVPTRTSVALDSNPPTKYCEILGIGLEGGPNTYQATQNTEVINFKGCKVEFTRDPVTKGVVKAQLLDSPLLHCTAPFMNPNKTLIPRPVAELELKEPGPGGRSYGKGKFADGFNFSSGKGSCTTYVIGGVVYTWGTEPCPCDDGDPECQ